MGRRTGRHHRSPGGRGRCRRTAYTAHDLHDLRTTAATCTSEEQLTRLALICSVSLYLDLANLVGDAATTLGSVGADAAHAGLNALSVVGDVVCSVLGVVREIVLAVFGDLLGEL